MTCITYLNGVMMADRLSVVDNNNVPIIVDTLTKHQKMKKFYEE